MQWAPERAGGAHAAGDNSLHCGLAAPATRVLTASSGIARARASARDGRGRRRRGGGERVRHRRAARVRVLLRGVAPHAPGVLATGARDGGVRLWATVFGSGGGARNARVVAACRSSAACVAATAMAATARERCGVVGFAASSSSTGWTSRAAARAGAPPRSLRERKDLLGEPIGDGAASRPPTGGLRDPPPTASAASGPSDFAATHTFDCDAGRARNHARHRRGAGVGGGGALRASAEGALRRLGGERRGGSPGAHVRALGAAAGGRRRRTARRGIDVDVIGVRVALPAAARSSGVRVNDGWSPAARACVAGDEAGGGARSLRRRARRACARWRPAAQDGPTGELRRAACRARAWRPP